MTKFKIKEVHISEIKLLKKNAHFMNDKTFRALVENIKRDGALSSVPFCVEHTDGTMTVISGNHRVQAAKQAGLLSIPVMYVLEENTSKDWLLATQLSHNSIFGQDDAEIVKQILDEITDVAMKEYAHISQEYLNAVNITDYSVELPNNEVVPITLMFVDTQKASFDRITEQLEIMTNEELNATTLLPLESLKRLNEVSAKIQTKYKIKSQALSICKMLEIVDNYMSNGNEE